MEFSPNKYQTAVKEHLNDPTNLGVISGPGTGKTKTIWYLNQHLDRNVSVLNVAFNKHIQLVLEREMPEWSTNKTYHSLGLAGCTGVFGRVKVDNRKVYSILKNSYKYSDYSDKWLYPLAGKLVSLCKNNLLSPNDSNLGNLRFHFNVGNGNDDKINWQRTYDMTKYAYNQSLEMTKVIDFDDMCAMPELLDLSLPKYDRILVDEVQDTNAAQRALIKRSVHTESKVIGVGDPLQSIYAFRGADSDAMQLFVDDFQADTLPLSITYRCPKSVVEFVNGQFPDGAMEYPEWANQGEIADVKMQYLIENAQAGDMILCRVNAELVAPCYELIRRGIKAQIKGRDIGKGLIKLINRIKKKYAAENLNELLEFLSDYTDKEKHKLLIQGKDGAAASLDDKAETVFALSDGVETIESLINRCETIFSDDIDGVVFSTVHKAKGLESDRVFILRPDLMPHPMAKKPWEAQQERNIMYVAFTRTKDKLFFITGGQNG